MAYKLVPSDQFRADLVSLAGYISENLGAPQAAKRIVDDIVDATKRIAATPSIKAISKKPKLRQLRYREYYIDNYAIVYRVHEDAAYLLRLFHQSQNYENDIESDAVTQSVSENED